jgi:tetratricopeptide (TPR) repeat protein
MLQRYLFAFSICIAALLVSQLAPSVPPDLPSHGFVVGLLHEIGETAKLAIALLLAVSLVFEKALQEFMGPFLERLFTGLGMSVQQGLENGMRSVSEKVQEALGKIQLVRSQAQAETEIAADVPEPILELVRAGNIEEALKRAHSKGDKLTILVLSQDPMDWQKAATILLSTNADAKYYSILAYKFWTAGDLDRAIPLAECGLTIAIQRNDTMLEGRLKNSLAYYYALTQKPDYEDKARQYIADARRLIPDMIMEIVDTEGFIKIVYGKTRSEVTEGVELSYQATKALSRIEDMAERTRLAAERLKSLQK